jgi:hypothetical protein
MAAFSIDTPARASLVGMTGAARLAVSSPNTRAI